jgi:ribonuclease-3
VVTTLPLYLKNSNPDLFSFFADNAPDYFAKDFKKSLIQILGFRPRNYNLYYTAFLHSSYANSQQHLYKKHNERLEFLGDLILDAIVGDFLYKNYPHMDEGELTRVKTKFINRKTLNQLAERIGIEKLLVADFKLSIFPEDAKGNTLEALIGAIYLDRGFDFTRKIVMSNFYDRHLNMLAMLSNDDDYKSKLFRWAQKNRRTLRYVTSSETGRDQDKEYTIDVYIDDEIVGSGTGKNKKIAEQKASHDACEKLYI